MKQRKLYTKIWKDDWFCSLSNNARFLFLYLLTNEQIGFTGCYELSDRQILFDTKLTSLDRLKQELLPKVVFYSGWVYILNSQGYNNFVGDSFEVAINKEKDLIPKNIKETLLQGKTYPTPPITPTRGRGINSNSNSNYNNINTLREKDLIKIAEKYDVDIPFVKSKLDDMTNWLGANGKKYSDYYLALCNWVKRDKGSFKRKVVNQEFQGVPKISEEERLENIKKWEEMKKGLNL